MVTANTQYGPGDEPVLPNRMAAKEKIVTDLETLVKSLQAANESNTKIIAKMRRDITRLKDQISELAGQIKRG
jgi:phage shock protein A